MKKNTILNLFNTPKNLAETISLGLIFYMVLVVIAISIGLALTSFFNSERSDVAAVVSNMLVWSATLMAPLIALLLLNTWKHQKDYDLKKESIFEILEILARVRYSLVLKEETIIELKRIKEFAVIKNSYYKFDFSEDEKINELFFTKKFRIDLIKDDQVDTKEILNIYSKLHREYVHSNHFFTVLMDYYKKYYSEITNQIEIEKLNYAYEVFHRNYERLKIDQPTDLIYTIVRQINVPRAYKVFSNIDSSSSEIVSYDNMEVMIKSIKSDIDSLENKLFLILKNSD
ncbi:hypothetical protein A7P53_00055 [Acinetobacter defluvii]|uniref:hypothetical protein n=1 Tax=Acinetobacter defluvii TaxID=1871111 RepID=UPI00149089AE|nr:hypothetical protein [Acinetobacter defluvii]NNP71285.1 hypothetical protein [Acinetobacter defluvii]